MTYAYNGLNQPLQPDPTTAQMVPGLLDQLQASGYDVNSMFGQPQMVGAGTQGSGFAGVGQTLATMADNRRINQQNEALARQMGFPDYATFRAYQQKRMGMQHGAAPAGGVGAAAKSGLDSAKMLHPSYLLDWVNERIKGAIK